MDLDVGFKCTYANGFLMDGEFRSTHHPIQEAMWKSGVFYYENMRKCGYANFFRYEKVSTERFRLG